MPLTGIVVLAQWMSDELIVAEDARKKLRAARVRNLNLLGLPVAPRVIAPIGLQPQARRTLVPTIAAEVPEPEDPDPRVDSRFLKSKWERKITIIPGTVISNDRLTMANLTYQGNVKPKDEAFAFALNNWQPIQFGGTVQKLGYKIYNVTVKKS